MRDRYAKYNQDHRWLITEDGWVKALQGIREAQMAIGNGIIGNRAALEEMPYDAKPLTYIAGLYDNVGSQVDELVNFPNPFNFKMTVGGGEKVGLVAMDVLEHRRALNLRHGLLSRHSVYRDTEKRRYDYQSLRFLSMKDKDIGVMQVAFTSLDADMTISVETGIDTSVYNAGTATEGRKKHFRVRELGQFENEGFLLVETFNKHHAVIFRSGFYYESGGKKTYAEDNIFHLKLKKAQTVVFTKVICIDYVYQIKDRKAQLERLKKTSEKKFRHAFEGGFHRLLGRHKKAWEDIWETAEVSIWDEADIERNFRFCLYHMLICAPQDNGASSIGARSMTGEGYRGHIFWDTELFLLPFYIYTMPQAAKNILLYRYKRLDAARKRAAEGGYKGAMFPWESAEAGDDQTPDRARDFDGRIIKIYTGQAEHHITADIAFAFYHYYNAAGDAKFLGDYGLEVIFEAARFWASRAEYNKRSRHYEIRRIIGPDEFHEYVNNNAFTNMMAKWNLLCAFGLFKKAKKESPELLKELSYKIGLSATEAGTWKSVASRLRLNKTKSGVIEQFDGYFRKKEARITSWDENNLAVIPRKLSSRDYGKTKLIKQADVVMLLNLLSDVFNRNTKKTNYDYYLPRTAHKSSLSLSMYALLASDVGDMGRAYRFFQTVLRNDISNIHGNTAEGVHAASAGGAWQVLINGFAGARMYKDALSVNPNIPSAWRKVLFSVNYRGAIVKLEISNTKVRVKIKNSQNGKRRKKIRIRIFDAMRELSPGRTYEFIRRGPARAKKRQYYI